MTDQRGTTPAGRRASLLARMAAEAGAAGVVARRIHLVVAIDRLLVRLVEAAPGAWVVKGGYANQLRRPDAARFTEDLDLASMPPSMQRPSCSPRRSQSTPGTTLPTPSNPRRRSWTDPRAGDCASW